MRESLLNKKLRLAADLTLLVPVTPEIVDIANTFPPAAIASRRWIIAFDASMASDGTRPVVVVFCEDGDCHLIDKYYYDAPGTYVPDTFPHGLDLVKEEARVGKLRGLSAVARERELAIRLFIHFIDAINPTIDRGVGGQYMALYGAWNEQERGSPRPEDVKRFQEHLDMIVWSDPAIIAIEPCVIEWDGHEPGWDGSYEGHYTPVDWTSRDDFEKFRSSVLSGNWGSLSIKSEALLTERFAASCWCLCAQFQDALVDMTTVLEYSDGDSARRSGYTREYSSELVQFVARGAIDAERNNAKAQYALWFKRLHFYSAGWMRYNETKAQFIGDTAGRSRSEMANLKEAFLALEAGNPDMFPYRPALGLYIPPILTAD